MLDKCKRMARRFAELGGYGLLASVGLEYIDLQLITLLGRRKRGVFVEAGAFDGVRQSNTYYLERHLGWRGLLVEPDPVVARRCKNNRPKSVVEQCCLVASDYPHQHAQLQQAGLMSVVDDKKIDPTWAKAHLAQGRRIQHLNSVSAIQVPAVPLQVLLQKHNLFEIDFFSLDVEGYELEVLKGIDFSTVSFHNLFVECRRSNEREITDLLSEHGLTWSRRWENRDYSNVLFSDEAPPT